MTARSGVPVIVSTRVHFSTFSRRPVPSWPCRPRPHEYTTPPVVTSRLWAPAAILKGRRPCKACHTNTAASHIPSPIPAGGRTVGDKMPSSQRMLEHSHILRVPSNHHCVPTCVWRLWPCLFNCSRPPADSLAVRSKDYVSPWAQWRTPPPPRPHPIPAPTTSWPFTAIHSHSQPFTASHGQSPAASGAQESRPLTGAPA